MTSTNEFLQQSIPDDPNLILAMNLATRSLIGSGSGKKCNRGGGGSPFFNFMKIRRRQMEAEGIHLQDWEEVKEIVGSEWIRLSKEEKDALKIVKRCIVNTTLSILWINSVVFFQDRIRSQARAFCSETSEGPV